MQHKCTVCGKMYDQGAHEILNGCACGNKLFYFVNNNKKAKHNDNNAEYFYELEDDENNELIIFDVETVKIITNGKYEIDINALMNNQPLVYQYGEGKYSIDLDKQARKKK